MKPISQTNIAEQRIKELFVQADENFKEYPKLSKRYVFLARKIAMKYRIKLSSDQKKTFCKKCNAYLKMGYNATIRTRNGKIILTCKECGGSRRIIHKR